MTWVRLDDGFAEHPKTFAVGPYGVTLYVRALCWCSRRLSDGILPRSVLPSLMSDIPDQGIPERLVTAGLWEIHDESSFLIHDYLEYNPSKKQVLKKRKAGARRVQEFRKRNAGGNAGSNATSNASRNADVRLSPAPTPSSTSSPPSVSKSPVVSLEASEKKQPLPIKREEVGQSPVARTWAAYSEAYRARHGTDPTWNARVAGNLGQFVKRVPAAEAPAIAAFFVRHGKQAYLSRRHPVWMLLQDAETLRTEWVTGQQMTESEAREADRLRGDGQRYRRVIEHLHQEDMREES